MPSTIVKVANTSLIALLERVHKGDEVTIERDGQAVALLVSTNSAEDSKIDSEVTLDTQNHAFKTVDDEGFQQLCDAYASAV
jgi:antitoxin (DNA-binding transcriptional repressor) of toxin-antitoxin stability system